LYRAVRDTMVTNKTIANIAIKLMGDEKSIYN